MVSRFFIVWGLLHAALIIIEVIRFHCYKGGYNNEFYVKNKLLGITYIVYAMDFILAIAFVLYLCYNYIINGVLL